MAKKAKKMPKPVKAWANVKDGSLVPVFCWSLKEYALQNSGEVIRVLIVPITPKRRKKK